MANVVLIVSIDTEEDNWEPRRDGVTLGNIRELRRLDGLLRKLGVRATYFTTYQVAAEPWTADIVRSLAEGGHAEVGAHLHPWNTPPLDEPFLPRNTMLTNLPPGLQLAKLVSLTTALTEALGAAPTIFRAGRYGLGPATVAALIQCGYRVDCSVTPFVNWQQTDDGPDFVGAPVDAYRLSAHGDVRRPEAAGPLLEIPVSVGYNRTPFAVWGSVRRALEAPALRPLHLAGVASRTGLVKRIVLNPEVATAGEMLTLSRRLIESGVHHLHATWHSPTLRPGLSPFAETAADVERLYTAIAAYVEGLSTITPLTFATVSEAAAMLDGTARAPTPSC